MLMTATKYIIGNWKMNGSRDMAWKMGLDLHQFLASNGRAGVKMAICPPFLYLPLLSDFLLRHESALGLGGQDCHAAESGAFTGNVSAAMLRDAGCQYAIVGHSERRQYHGETDDMIGKKVLAAQKSGLIAILCIGETLAEKEAGQTLSVLSAQLRGCLQTGITVAGLIVAYEPVWAIGTGRNATNDDIVGAHRHIRAELAQILGAGGNEVAILYGGSVKASNAKEILSAPGVDGVLVGGASLKFDEFSTIYSAALI